MSSTSSGTSIGSTRKRGYSDDGDGQPKKLLLETSSDEGHSVASNVRKQEGQVEMMTSPIVGYDPSSVVSYTVSYPYMCVCARIVQ